MASLTPPPFPPPVATAERPRTPWAIPALICSLIPFPGLGIAGIVFGVLGLRQAKRLGMRGRGMVVAGIVVGVIFTIGNAGGIIVAIVDPDLGGGSRIPRGLAIETALAKVRNDHRVTEALGTPLEVVSSRSDVVYTGHTDGTTETKFAFAVRGPNGMATVQVTLASRFDSDRCRLKDLVVVCREENQSIVVVGAGSTDGRATAHGEELDTGDYIGIVLGIVIAPAWVLALIFGIRAARRKGISPHWMWFGIHPLGAFIACPIIMWGVAAHVCPQCNTPIHRGVPSCPSCKAPFWTSLRPVVTLMPVSCSTTEPTPNPSVSPPPMIVDMQGAKLALIFRRHALDFWQYLGIPWGTCIGVLDGGWRFTVPWREDAVLDIGPGWHRIGIAMNYFGFVRGVCKAAADFEIKEGDFVRIEYTVPATIFGAGVITVTRSEVGANGHSGPSSDQPQLPRSGFAVASLIVGLVSIPLCLFFGIPSIVGGALAIVCARKGNMAVEAGRAGQSSAGMAKVGKMFGIIGIVVGGISLAFAIVWALLRPR